MCKRKGSENMAVLTSNCKLGFILKNDCYDKFVNDKNKLSQSLQKKNAELLSKFSKQVEKD